VTKVLKTGLALLGSKEEVLLKLGTKIQTLKRPKKENKEINCTAAGTGWKNFFDIAAVFETRYLCRYVETTKKLFWRTMIHEVPQ
jgi:hypothetical protein